LAKARSFILSFLHSRTDSLRISRKRPK
jgi:hypothetical protein